MKTVEDYIKEHGFCNWQTQEVIEEAKKEISESQQAAQELRDVLMSVQEEFRKYGNSFPDGFNGRVFRWVDDALAYTPKVKS